MKIITQHIYPPIPIRDYDWEAIWEDYDESDYIGYGRTEEAAIENLMEQTTDDRTIEMNHYKQKDGTRISKAEIDRRVRKTKAVVLENQRTEHGYNFCVDCGRSSGRLDCSHIVSVDKCQKMGRAELAFDESNIEVLCRECHQLRDKLTINKKTI